MHIVSGGEGAVGTAGITAPGGAALHGKIPRGANGGDLSLGRVAPGFIGGCCGGRALCCGTILLRLDLISYVAVESGS